MQNHGLLSQNRNRTIHTNVFRPETSLIPVRYKVHPRVNDLKEDFLHSLSRCDTGMAGLRVVVRRAIDAGISRTDLVEWGVSANYSAQYMRKILSLCLLGRGVRTRRSGAGRKPSKEALDLLSYARKLYGDDAGKYLRAAYRAFHGEACQKRQSVSSPPSGTSPVFP